MHNVIQALAKLARVISKAEFQHNYSTEYLVPIIGDIVPYITCSLLHVAFSDDPVAKQAIFCDEH